MRARSSPTGRGPHPHRYRSLTAALTDQHQHLLAGEENRQTHRPPADHLDPEGAPPA